MGNMKRLMLALAFSFAAISMADAAGDPAKGEKVFRICSACHTEITAQLGHNLQMQQFVMCRSCGRMLYMKDV